MKVKIYQINLARDIDKVAFCRYDMLPELQQTAEVNSSLYDQIFDGELQVPTLEHVFQETNMGRPEGYRGRSMSVSDVIGVERDEGTSYFYVDSWGFREIRFEPEKARKA